MIPEEIREAARRKLAEGKYHAEPNDLDRRPREGSVVRVVSYPDSTGDQISRLALVVAIDEVNESAKILLASSATEFATDLDLVAAPEDTGLPYPLLVEGELYGRVFDEQIDAVLASTDQHLAAAANAALATDGESLQDYMTGWPLTSFDDARVEFKESELDQLEKLVYDYRRMVDGLAAPNDMLDLTLLVPPPSGTDPDLAGEQFLALLDVVEQLGPGYIEVPAEWLDDDEGVLLEELSRWQAEFGLPVSRILDRIVVTSPADTAPNNLDLAVEELDPTARADNVIKNALLSRGQMGPAVVGIYTTKSAWSRRFPKEFITERVSPTTVVRAFARTLEDTAA